MQRRHAAVAVVAVALLALLGAATPVTATNGTATANGTATTADTATTTETTEANATWTTVADDAVRLITNGDGAVVVRPAPDQTVRGTSSLPEGTELSVRMRSSGGATFLKSKTATVGADGEFAVTFDFDGLAEDAPIEATVSVRAADGGLVREYEAVVRSAAETESPGGTTAGDTTSATVPGFGAATAGAGIAAALVGLARTRRTD